MSQLAAVNQVLSQATPPAARLHALVRELAHFDDVGGADIFVLRRDTRELVHAASEPEGYNEAVVIAHRVIATEETVVLCKAGFGRDSVALALPIRAEDDVVGVLTVRRAPDAAMSDDDACAFYGIVAALAGPTVSMRQARLESKPNAQASPTRIMARASAMEPVFEMIDAVAASDATVLVRGESGTGKELVADAIHQLSHRRKGPFVKVNCAALADGVLESELFGHEVGAFTGATQLRIGRFESASNGTIFLDEIGDFSPSVQVILLRILQQQTFERVGGSQTLSSNARVIAATNRDLEGLMAEGKFREDLYYRLNVFPIHVPPLRERRSDILLLADAFVERFSRAFSKDVRRITSEAIDLLTAYHWPGNVRELENCIERATLLTRDGVIHAHDLPPTLQTAASSGTTAKGTLSAVLGGDGARTAGRCPQGQRGQYGRSSPKSRRHGATDGFARQKICTDAQAVYAPVNALKHAAKLRSGPMTVQAHSASLLCQSDCDVLALPMTSAILNRSSGETFAISGAAEAEIHEPLSRGHGCSARRASRRHPIRVLQDHRPRRQIDHPVL